MKRKFLSVLILVGVIAMVGLFLPVSRADGPLTADFESPAYLLGNIHGQQGWSKTGSYDVAVVANPGIAGFGSQSLRLTSAITSGSFGDQTFSMGLVQPAGETNANGFPDSNRQSHFDGSFDFASEGTALQTGLHMSVSPDRGDGARMSYLRFDDTGDTDGIHVFFDDVQGTSNPANFVETQVATLTRGVKHTIRFSMNLIDGPSNDVVYIYIDGFIVHTGTTWENYYLFDPESAAEGVWSRTVDKMLFRESGTAVTTSSGLLVDNVSLASGPLTIPPTTKDQCKNSGWKTFNSPAYKTQGDCIQFVNTGR